MDEPEKPTRKPKRPFTVEHRAPEPEPPVPAIVTDPRPKKPEDQRHCGLNAVSALFAKRPEAVFRLLYTDARKTEVGGWCKLLAAAKRPYRLLPEDEMEAVAGTLHHGGVVAVAAPVPVRPFSPAQIDGPAPVLVLDGVGNPQNFGAIVRTAAFLGVRHVILSGDARQAYPSDAAIRVAEGALEQVSLWRARLLAPALAALGRRFTTLATALGPGGIAPDAVARDRPVAIVLGNEEEGLAAETVAACAHVLTIPGSGAVQSLNVGAAAAILAWHFRAPASDAPLA
jgi:TrmH RNA methyltransferase